MTNWQGHNPTVAKALSQIVDRASSGAGDLSRGERLLYTVAEFWAALRTHELASRLKRDPENQLLAASVAFIEMGAPEVAGKLRVALCRIQAAPVSQRKTREVARSLERELLNTDEPVDQLLAKLAANHIYETRLRSRNL